MRLFKTFDQLIDAVQGVEVETDDEKDTIENAIDCIMHDRKNGVDLFISTYQTDQYLLENLENSRY